MDVIKYRHYIVSGAEYCCISTGEVFKWGWPWRHRLEVRKGHAYYLTKKKVVVGYQITNSTVSYKVFLPAFSSNRESFLSNIRNYINKFAKFHVATFRMKLHMKVIDTISHKSLPEGVLNMIGLYCYDPFLLSK